MKIQVDGIDTAALDIDDPHYGVHVGTVAIDQTTPLMDDVGDLFDMFFK